MQIDRVEYTKEGAFIVNKSDTYDGRQLAVPDDMGNRHRVMIQEWIDAGNTPTPYTAPEEPYQDKRIKAYGSINEQLDMQYKDLVNDTTVWKDHIAKVKSDIPKE